MKYTVKYTLNGERCYIRVEGENAHEAQENARKQLPVRARNLKPRLLENEGLNTRA